MENIVITTKFILDQNSPILNVYRDVEGDWQFIGNEEATEADAMIVSLSNILDHDSTIKDIVSILQPGFSAHRNSVSEEWEINRLDV